MALGPVQCVIVRAPARLHFGLFQMSRAYATAYMGFGGALSRPHWVLKAQIISGDKDLIINTNQELRTYAAFLLGRLRKLWHLPHIRLETIEEVPLHVGLGAKTSFGCALLAAANKMAGRSRPWPEYRWILHRGGASGVGINSSVIGGLVVDSGHSIASCEGFFPSSKIRHEYKIPQVLGRWSAELAPLLLLTRLPGQVGFSGDKERDFFSRRTPVSSVASELISSLVLFNLIPSLIRADHGVFISTLEELQSLGFKREEWATQSEKTKALRDYAMKLGARAAALTSMGPTVAIFGGDAHSIGAALHEKFGAVCTMTSFQNTGVTIDSVREK